MTGSAFEIVSTWIMVDVTVGVLRFLGPLGGLVILALVVALALVPLFDRKPETELRQRPFVTALGVFLFGGFLVAWIVGHRVDVPPTADVIPVEILEERAIPGPSVEADPRPEEIAEDDVQEETDE